MSVDNPTDDCHLLFSPDTSMYVHYPNQKTCCKLCSPGIGCTPLRFDWIANATLAGTEQVKWKLCSFLLIWISKRQDDKKTWRHYTNRIRVFLMDWIHCFLYFHSVKFLKISINSIFNLVVGVFPCGPRGFTFGIKSSY